MQIKSKFDELSSDLTQGERKEMLEKINKNKEEEADGEYYVHIELPEDDRKRLIREDVQRLSLWRRFLLWIIRTLTGRDRDQIFISMRIAEIKRAIKRANPGLSGFETRDLTVKFIRCVYDLYTALWPVKDFYQYYVGDPTFKELIVFALIAGDETPVKSKLDDFLETEELEELYARPNGQAEIQAALAKRLEDHFKSLPGSLFQKAGQKILPIIALKNVTLFNYKEFFQYFDYYLTPTLDQKYPVFRGTPALLVIDHLERLYYAIYYALKNTEGSSAVSEEVLALYVIRRLGLDPQKDAREIEKRRDDIQRETQTLVQALQTLLDEIMKFNSLVPVLDIIKFFRRDPYYRFKFYIPALPLRQMYSQSLRKKLKADVESKIVEIKDRVIDRKIRELFRDMPLASFNNYSDGAAEFYLRQGLPYFTRVKSLALLLNYVKRVYREFIQEVVQSVNALIFKNNKRNQNRLLQCASTIEELEDKIMWFDKALAPEEDDGKLMARLKHNIASDLTHQKLFKSFLNDKDRDALALLEKGIEQFSTIRDIFEEILANQMEGVQSLLKTAVSIMNKQYSLGQSLRMMTANIGDFLKLIAQVMEMEKGRS